jgi:hypothetical protein
MMVIQHGDFQFYCSSVILSMSGTWFEKMGAKYILELGPLLPCIHESCLHYEQFTILKKNHREHHLTNVQQFIIRQMFSNSQRASIIRCFGVPNQNTNVQHTDGPKRLLMLCFSFVFLAGHGGRTILWPTSATLGHPQESRNWHLVVVMDPSHLQASCWGGSRRHQALEDGDGCGQP